MVPRLPENANIKIPLVGTYLSSGLPFLLYLERALISKFNCEVSCQWDFNYCFFLVVIASGGICLTHPREILSGIENPTWVRYWSGVNGRQRKTDRRARADMLRGEKCGHGSKFEVVLTQASRTETDAAVGPPIYSTHRHRA